MKTDIDKHYKALELARHVLEPGEGLPYARQLATALLDLEERRQLALGELGEANMKEGGGPLYAYIDRTTQILNLTKEV